MIKRALLIVFLILFVPLSAIAATHYIATDGNDTTGDGSTGTPWATLSKAFDEMSGGDTLIMKNGTYQTDDNIITTAQSPPVGTAEAYTKIQAETPGSVIIDGEGARQPFYYEPGSPTNVYWEFTGIVFANSSSTLFYLVRANYAKFLRCGGYDAADNADLFATHTCTYILFEDCYSWGNARYHFHYYATTNSIFRRCVARHDRGTWQYQMGFQVYASENIEVQNCIVIDGDQTAYYNNPDQYYAYKIPQVNSGNITFAGNIALNTTGGFFFVQAGDNNTVTNCAAWDLANGDYCRGTGVDITHCTYGEFTGDGTQGDITTKNFNNNILYNIGNDGITSFGGTTNNDYNALYGNTDDFDGGQSAGANSLCADNANAIDPLDGTPGNGTTALKYLTQIEAGSDLITAGSGSTPIGATILYRYGDDGDMWGDETGSYDYNELSNVELWPFPYEDTIRTAMMAYSYDSGGLSGARGFCAPNTTLTEYIWEYLGNEIPEDIYGEDETAPVISGESPSGEQPCSEDPKTITISVNTDEAATCRYSLDGDGGDDEDTAYADLNNEFTTTGGTGHSSDVSSACDGSYTYWVRCTDGTNASTESTEISYTVGVAGISKIMGNGTKMFTTSGGKLLKN